MIPARREPFSRAMLRTMLEVPSGLRISVRGIPALIWDSWFGYNYAAMMLVCASGGFRKAEVALGSGVTFDAMHLSRVHLFWVLGHGFARGGRGWTDSAEKRLSIQDMEGVGTIEEGTAAEEPETGAAATREEAETAVQVVAAHLGGADNPAAEKE